MISNAFRTRAHVRKSWAVIVCLMVIIAACGPAGPTPAVPESPGLALTLTAWPTSPPGGFPTPLARVGTPQPIWTATASAIRSPTSPTTPALPTGSPTSPPPAGSPSPPVQLAIPALDLDAAVVPVAWEPVADGTGGWTSQWQTADGAVGHLVTSANLGERGNVVLAGHHNTRGEVFRDLSEIGLPGARVAVGDEVIVTAADGGVYVYTIREWQRWEYATAPDEERHRQASYLEPTPDPTLTLVTCWPYESNTHRVVVVAELAP